MKATPSSSPVIILRDFSLNRDLRRVAWRATLVYNGMRAFGCGISWMLLGLMAPPAQEMAGSLFIPVVWPVFYFFCLVIGGPLSAMKIGGVADLMLRAMAAFTVSLGDPIVFGLSLIKPGLVPMAHPPIFSLQLIWMVLHADEHIIVDERKNRSHLP